LAFGSFSLNTQLTPRALDRQCNSQVGNLSFLDLQQMAGMAITVFKTYPKTGFPLHYYYYYYYYYYYSNILLLSGQNQEYKDS